MGKSVTLLSVIYTILTHNLSSGKISVRRDNSVLSAGWLYLFCATGGGHTMEAFLKYMEFIPAYVVDLTRLIHDGGTKRVLMYKDQRRR
jgi:hypothetical protein